VLADYPLDIEANNEGRSSQVINVESPAKYVIPLCVVACVFAAAAFLYCVMLQRQVDAANQLVREYKTQSWLTERRLLDIEAYAILNHWALPTDKEHGPLGNVERMKESEHAR
jgi:hypothetical protein